MTRQQFFYCCVCIRYRGNVSTEPLPSNDKGIFSYPLPSNDKGIFTEPLSSNDRGYTFLDTTRASLKTTRPTIILVLRVYSLPR
jgi:hypothetical protein